VSAFGENAFPNKTLLQVLGLGGGGLNALGRHTVAALLNSTSPFVDYAYTENQVIQKFQAAYPGTNAGYEALKNEFQAANESTCDPPKGTKATPTPTPRATAAGAVQVPGPAGFPTTGGGPASDGGAGWALRGLLLVVAAAAGWAGWKAVRGRSA
jgi:hypothetical protein